MIGYIKGTLTEIQEESLIVENGNIGFVIRVPQLVSDRLAGVGSEVKLYTYMLVREDDISLYGFLSKDELEVFKLLLTVSGVGPKGALGILSVLSCSDLRIAVHSQDAKAIAKAPGIGAKTAQRIIIDLKDRLKLEDAWDLDGTAEQVEISGENSVQKEAIEALVALGYGLSVASAAVLKVDMTAEMTVEECLKLSLKHML